MERSPGPGASRPRRAFIGFVGRLEFQYAFKVIQDVASAFQSATGWAVGNVRARKSTFPGCGTGCYNMVCIQKTNRVNGYLCNR